MEEIPNPYGDHGFSSAEPTPALGSTREEVISFALKHRANKVIVTPIIAVACIAMFVVVSIADKNVMNPTGQTMLAHGANFGPKVVFDNEAWRLFTCTFLHFGLIHLALNLWCLSSAGPVLERFLGSASFAALYVLAGLGGSIASLWVHPVSVGAGASGAIFGVFGGLLGYLAIRRHEVPTAVLEPMRNGALAFIFYNVVLGFTSPTTDNAAHLGGLVTGFVTGLLMTATGSANAGKSVRLAGRLAAVGAVAAGLFGLEHQGVVVARDRIKNDPKIGPIVLGEFEAAPAYNTFIERSQPILNEFVRIEEGVEKIIQSLKGKQNPAELDAALQRLLTDSQALEKRITALPAGNDDIVAMRGRLGAARDRQDHALESLRKYLQTGDPSAITGPAGLQAQRQAYTKEFQELNGLRDAYFKKYSLTLTPKTP